jgi:8-oxo-dGTP pyrophosphatase MutT (NUDIX family)
MSPRIGTFYPSSASLTALDPHDTTGAVTDAPARPPTPQEAAAIIVARDAPAGLEALLLQRHPKSRFSPGAFAFPGGRLEAADAGPGIEARCRDLGRSEAARRLRDVRPAERAIGFWVTALRELFEEAGMLLAYGPDARPLSAASLEGFRDQRARCREESVTFGRLLADRGLTLATDRVGYWAHWITPEERPIRYDTRFFVAPTWADQVVEPDGLEMVAARWIRPSDALAGHTAGDLVLPLPTQRILASLSEHAGVAGLLSAAEGRDIRSIRPRIIRDAGGERVLLPEDPDWF